MKKSLSLIFLLCTLTSFAQVEWIKSYDVARAKALSENKFIVMDFWAIWCGPCKKMDKDMWNTAKMAAVKDKFVFLKIDVDSNRDLAVKYNARSIPKVVIMDAIGNVIWEETGFGNAAPYIRVFKQFPTKPAPGADISKVMQEQADANTLFSLGAWYQQASKDTESVSLKKGILNQSDALFRQAAKEAATDAMAKEVEFNLVLNYAYRGAYKKAMKKVEKMEETDMKNFILAYCYKCDGQNEKMQEFMDKISSAELLSQLN